MKQWYAKELSQLTQVSVRALHHYDKIGLLMPSMRLSNGYRYTDRIRNVLNQVGTQSSANVLALWNDVLDDMYGDDDAIKKERASLMIETALNNEMVSEDAKKWLRGLSKS